MPLYLDNSDAERLLNDWVEMNLALMSLPAAPVLQLLEAEVAGRRRPQVLSRLHQRFNKLRAREERARIAKGDIEWRYL